jgi:hypothetical protein
LAHIEMREKPGILEHIADPAAMRWNVHARAGIVQRLPVDGDEAAIGPQAGPRSCMVGEFALKMS